MKAKSSIIEPHTQCLVIDQNYARQLLLKNTCNRPIYPGHLRVLVDAIRAGKWKMNGETIKIAKDGTLMDGQHRLLAVVETGIAITALVMFDLDMSVSDTIGIGKKRTGADSWAMRGEKNASLLSATLSLLHGYFNSRERTASIVVPFYDQEKTLVAHPTIRESVSWASSRHVPFLAGTVMSALHYIFTQLDREMGQAFCDGLYSGLGLTKGDPIHTLRERLIGMRAERSRYHTQYVLALCIKGWNLYRLGKTRQVLLWRQDEGFPSAQ